MTSHRFTRTVKGYKNPFNCSPTIQIEQCEMSELLLRVTRTTASNEYSWTTIRTPRNEDVIGEQKRKNNSLLACILSPHLQCVM